jgi:hypothetical protein
MHDIVANADQKCAEVLRCADCLPVNRTYKTRKRFLRQIFHVGTDTPDLTTDFVEQPPPVIVEIFRIEFHTTGNLFLPQKAVIRSISVE